MRTLRLSLIMLCVAGATTSPGANLANNKTPVLVELFTSEGCSSCPPVEAWLQRVDAAQPLPGAQMIVLSEHVDYWDHDGWKDPFALTFFTERQVGYVRALKLETPYTPQAIVNGKSELRFSEPQQVSEILEKAASAPQIPVRISALSVDASATPLLRAHIDVDGEEEKRSADIFAAVALDHAESHVTRGENGGKLLTHVAVVQEMVKVGKLDKGKAFSRDIQVKLRPGFDSSNLRLVVFVQEPDLGQVVGAALQKSTPPAK
jgi:hypothetical protein